MRFRGITLSAVVLVFSLRLLGQESTVKGSLGGTVYDPSNAVVAKAKITLTGPTGTKTATTDPEGRFDFDILTPGFYSVRVEATGFKLTDVKQIEVFVNRTSTIHVNL